MTRAALLAAALLLAPVALARQDAAALAAQRGSEGPLDNDAFLAAHAEASAALASFDKAFVELRSKAVEDATLRSWTLALEELERALRDSRAGDTVAPVPAASGAALALWPDPDGTADPRLDRRREGVEVALERRLRALPADARALWIRLVGERGAERLARARRDFAALREVERNFPWTRAAFVAALTLADHELESAAPGAALRWLERAERHGRACAAPLATIETRAALARAELAAQELARNAGKAAVSAPDEAPVASWSDATRIEPRGAVALDELAQRFARTTLEPGLGVRAGMCFLEGERAVVHVPSSATLGNERLDRLVIVDLREPARVSVATPLRLLEPLGVQPGVTERPVEPPGWPLAPATDGRAIVVTLGRRSYDNDNVLAAIDLVELKGSAAPPEAQLRWAWQGGRRVAGAGLASGASETLDWGALEYQPGAVVADGLVYTLAREFVGGAAGDETAETQARSVAEIRTWLACFDLASGELRWRTFLGKGNELQRSAGRFFSTNVPTAAAQPLSFDGARLFAGSHTGFGALVDALDGRVEWSLRYRRRDPQTRTWSGGAPALDLERKAIAWAPADSDHLYWVRGEPDLEGRGLFVAAPRRHGEASVLVGGDASSAVVLSQVGAARAAASWDAASGATALAPELGPAERFSGEGLASPTRAWFASNRGLYLLDRERDLYLLDYAGLKPPFEGAATTGGSVHARGEVVCVLGATTLWVFRAR